MGDSSSRPCTCRSVGLYKSLVTTTPAPPWRIGVLAQRTGVTVRALRHYDALGLLKPSHRTDAGHRLYTRRDIERLQQIRSLRQLGLSLAEVRTCLLDRRVSVPSDPTVQALAKRWKSLVAEFTGGNAGVAEGVRRQYATEDPNPAQRRRLGLTREMFQYVGRAMETRRVAQPPED
jgi:DNA-binding transcriptional MerR regulator